MFPRRILVIPMMATPADDFLAIIYFHAEITGVNPGLIYRLKIILEVLTSGHNIDTEKFSVYARETAELYVELYSWHPMTPTLRKILIHGPEDPEVIETALLPIGQLSEEADETRNKYIRKYRLNFSRKFSREACKTDIINRLVPYQVLIPRSFLFSNARRYRCKTT